MLAYRFTIRLTIALFREHNMVRFRGGKPTGIYFSQHSDGSAYDWNDETLTVENERVRWWKDYPPFQLHVPELTSE